MTNLSPTFAQDVRATLRTYGAFIPRPVLQIISDAADHIEALQARVARLEEQLNQVTRENGR